VKRLLSVSSSSDTEFYIYFRTIDTDDGQNREGTWNSDFKLVLHMGDALSESTHSVDFESDNSQYAINSSPTTELVITGDLTIEAWVNLETIASRNIVLTFGEYGESESVNTLYHINIINDGTIKYLHEGTGAVNQYVQTTGSYITESGKWYHVAVTRDTTNKQIKFYVNGELKETISYDYNPTGGEDGKFFLGTGAALTDFFDGKIDDVRVWNVVRSAKQIKNLFDKELTGDESGLVGYWKLNNNFNDETSNANHLTGVNSPTFSTDTPDLIVDSTSNNNHGRKKGTGEPSQTTGKIGNAQSFDGTDDFITISDDASLNFGSDAFLVYEWVYRVNTDQTGHIMKGNVNGRSIWLEVRDSSYNYTVRGGFEKSGGANILSETTGTVSLNTWTFTGFRYDGGGASGNIYTFINDNQDGSLSTSDTPVSSTGVDLVLCRDAANGSYYSSGRSDEIRILHDSDANLGNEWLKAEYYSQSDNLLTFSGTLTLSKTKTFTADALIQKTQTKTFTADVLLQKTQTKTFTADARLSTIASKTYSSKFDDYNALFDFSAFDYNSKVIGVPTILNIIAQTNSYRQQVLTVEQTDRSCRSVTFTVQFAKNSYRNSQLTVRSGKIVFINDTDYSKNVISANINKKINNVDMATIQLIGDSTNSDFDIGNYIIIKAQPYTLFRGKIKKKSLTHQKNEFILEAYDPLMDASKKIYEDGGSTIKKWEGVDTDTIISDLATKAGLSAGKIDTLGTNYNFSIQTDTIYNGLKRNSRLTGYEMYVSGLSDGSDY